MWLQFGPTQISCAPARGNFRRRHDFSKQKLPRGSARKSPRWPVKNSAALRVNRDVDAPKNRSPCAERPRLSMLLTPSNLRRRASCQPAPRDGAGPDARVTARPEPNGDTSISSRGNISVFSVFPIQPETQGQRRGLFTARPKSIHRRQGHAAPGRRKFQAPKSS